MTDTATTTEEAQPYKGRGTVFYEAKRPLSKQYASAVASIYFPYEVGETETDTIKNAEDAFFAAKAMVAQQLGLEWELDDGIVRLVFEKEFGPVTEVVDHATTTPATSGEFADRGVEVEYRWKEPVPQWLYDAAAEKGVTKVKDVRRFLPANGGNGNPRAPWFKDSVSGDGFWPPKGA